MNVDELFEAALHDFLKQELSIIERGVSERGWCFRFGLHLERAKEKSDLGAYYTDAEYNRNETALKAIINNEGHLVFITADLILHSRGQVPDRDNLIAIEMKKAGRDPDESAKDRVRLRALTKPWTQEAASLPKHVCGYELGVFIEIDQKARSCQVEIFRSGDAAGVKIIEF